MEISKIHNELDSVLKSLGYDKTIDMKWGSISIQIDFQAGEEVLTVVERKTKKPNKG
jgi:hypothetical protein